MTACDAVRPAAGRTPRLLPCPPIGRNLDRRDGPRRRPRVYRRVRPVRRARAASAEYLAELYLRHAPADRGGADDAHYAPPPSVNVRV